MPGRARLRFRLGGAVREGRRALLLMPHAAAMPPHRRLAIAGGRYCFAFQLTLPESHVSVTAPDTS
jgi:hypothetical protein